MKKICFKKITNIWLEEKKKYVKLSTFCTYNYIVSKYLLPYFSSAERIKSKNIENFIKEKYEHKLSCKFIKDIMVVLEMILKFGREKRLFKNPQILYHLPKQKETNIIKCLDL